MKLNYMNQKRISGGGVVPNTDSNPEQRLEKSPLLLKRMNRQSMSRNQLLTRENLTHGNQQLKLRRK